MPTIFKEGGLSFRIYFNDHNPPHVHAYSQGGSAKIAIGDEDVKPSLLLVESMKRRDAKKALRTVGEHQQKFIQSWSEIHG